MSFMDSTKVRLYTYKGLPPPIRQLSNLRWKMFQDIICCGIKDFYYKKEMPWLYIPILKVSRDVYPKI